MPVSACSTSPPTARPPPIAAIPTVSLIDNGLSRLRAHKGRRHRRPRAGPRTRTPRREHPELRSCGGARPGRTPPFPCEGSVYGLRRAELELMLVRAQAAEQRSEVRTSGEARREVDAGDDFRAMMREYRRPALLPCGRAGEVVIPGSVARVVVVANVRARDLERVEHVLVRCRHRTLRRVEDHILAAVQEDPQERCPEWVRRLVRRRE